MDSCVSCALMPAVGSSSSSMRGSPASAMPSSTCFCAPWLTSPAIVSAMSCSASVPEQLPRSRRGTAARTRSTCRAAAAVGDECGLDVLEHGELGEDVGALERACHAHAADLVRRDAGDVAALQAHLAGVGLQMPGDEVEERRFAGAVRADDGGDAALLHAQAHVVGGDEAREASCAGFGTRASALRLRRQTATPRTAWRRRPTTPPGNANSRTSRMMPSTNGQYSV